MPRKIFIEKFYEKSDASETMRDMMWIIDELLLLEMPDKEDLNTTQYINMVGNQKSKKILSVKKCNEICS